ncbi:hypothetical protein BD769DRAFT_1397107 [Suillus cothurnatus]|nr:hypothetical protein BD769DRAFT_1397107 [Suillus cothurnatus]
MGPKRQLTVPGAMLVMWGSPENQHQHLDGGEPQAEPDLVWGDSPNVTVGSCKEKIGMAFLARRREGNKKREEKETPAQRQVHLSRTTSAGNQDLPTKKTTVFEWQPQDEFDGFRLRIRIMKNDVYSGVEGIHVPDGDWEDEIFAPSPSPPPPALLLPPPPQPPSRSSFLQDINQYFGQPEVHHHQHYSHGDRTSAPQGRSATFESWIRKTQWLHLLQTHWRCYLVMLRTSGLPEMPSDLWDLATALCDRAKSISKSVVWKLVVADTATAVMCLRRDWGSDITKIALNLLQKGITFKTLQAMAVAPVTHVAHTYFRRHELSEEEVDFMCGTYYSYNNDGTMDKVSWWPRPQAWAASGLNVGFWST